MQASPDRWRHRTSRHRPPSMGPIVDSTRDGRSVIATARIAAPLLDCDVRSSRSAVLRDEVAARTTPHEVTTQQGRLAGRVGAVTLPTSRLVFVRYGGDVTVEAPATGNRIVATVPLGPMHAREGRSQSGVTHASAFVLSRRDSTIMRPDPWHGALVVASDPNTLAEYRSLVLEEDEPEIPDSIVGLSDAPLLERACRNIWSVANTLPRETPEALVSGFLEALEEQLLTALVLASHRSAPLGTGDIRVDQLLDWLTEHYASNVTLSDMAGVLGVSIRCLQMAVRKATGRTPTDVLRDIRLAAAHQALREADPHVTTVASVAHACGITHLGRFSAQYRQVFGATPSQTLHGVR